MSYAERLPARARRLPPGERRAQLLRCALRVFARRGLGEARHAGIAKEAGVSVSTVFVYFPTRASLVDAVLGEVSRFLLEMADRIHAQDLPADEVVLQHATAFADSVETHPDLARVWLDWSTALREEVWPRYLEFQEQVVARIAETIRRGQREGTFGEEVDPEDDARLIVGSAHMIAQMMFVHRGGERVERFIRSLVHAATGDARSRVPGPVVRLPSRRGEGTP